MASIAYDSVGMQRPRSTTPTLSARSSSTAPRSATPQRSFGSNANARAVTPQRSSTPPRCQASPGSTTPLRSHGFTNGFGSDLAGNQAPGLPLRGSSLFNAHRNLTPQRVQRSQTPTHAANTALDTMAQLEQADATNTHGLALGSLNLNGSPKRESAFPSLHRRSAPQKTSNASSQGGHALRSVAAGASKAPTNAEAAKQALMRRIAADPAHARSVLASAAQGPTAGPSPSLFEDVRSPTVVLHQTPALQATHGGPLSGSCPPSRVQSPSKLLSGHTVATTAVSKSQEVEIIVGASKGGAFTEEKARILRQKMREMDNHHDTMYHSGLASRLA